MKMILSIITLTRIRLADTTRIEILNWFPGAPFGHTHYKDSCHDGELELDFFTQRTESRVVEGTSWGNVHSTSTLETYIQVARLHDWTIARTVKCVSFVWNEHLQGTTRSHTRYNSEKKFQRVQASNVRDLPQEPKECSCSRRDNALPAPSARVVTHRAISASRNEMSAPFAGEPERVFCRSVAANWQDKTPPKQEETRFQYSSTHTLRCPFSSLLPLIGLISILLVRWSHRWRSTRIISATSRRVSRRWKSSIMPKASCRYFTSWQSLSNVSQDSACVAPASRKGWPMALSGSVFRWHASATLSVNHCWVLSVFGLPVSLIELRVVVLQGPAPLVDVHAGHSVGLLGVVQVFPHAFLHPQAFAELIHGSPRFRIDNIALWVLDVQVFSGLLEGAHSCQRFQSLHRLLVEIVDLRICLSVVLVRCAEDPLLVAQDLQQSTQVLRRDILPNVDGCLYRPCHEHLDINTFVLYASIENVASTEDLPNFFSKCWKIFPVYRWFENLLFSNSGNDPSSFLVLDEFSSLFARVWSFCPSFQWVRLTFSCRFSWEFPTSKFWVGTSQLPEAKPTLFLSSSFTILTRDPDLCGETSSLHWLCITRLAGLAFVIGEAFFYNTLSVLRARLFSKMAARICRKAHDTEQTLKVIPLISMETSFG